MNFRRGTSFHVPACCLGFGGRDSELFAEIAGAFSPRVCPQDALHTNRGDRRRLTVPFCGTFDSGWGIAVRGICLWAHSIQNVHTVSIPRSFRAMSTACRAVVASVRASMFRNRDIKRRTWTIMTEIATVMSGSAIDLDRLSSRTRRINVTRDKPSILMPASIVLFN